MTIDQLVSAPSGVTLPDPAQHRWGNVAPSCDLGPHSHFQRVENSRRLGRGKKKGLIAAPISGKFLSWRNWNCFSSLRPNSCSHKGPFFPVSEVMNQRDVCLLVIHPSVVPNLANLRFHFHSGLLRFFNVNAFS